VAEKFNIHVIDPKQIKINLLKCELERNEIERYSINVGGITTYLVHVYSNKVLAGTLTMLGEEDEDIPDRSIEVYKVEEEEPILCIDHYGSYIIDSNGTLVEDSGQVPVLFIIEYVEESVLN